jgi:radical SAM protein with 4Fe4S-binding SPASM domain
MPRSRDANDGYGHARMPRGATAPGPEHIDRVAYGRFRNVYLYITEACQFRCEHCYMGERLERALKMPLPRIIETLATWRRLGGSKLTILGGEPTLHPDYCAAIRGAGTFETALATTAELAGGGFDTRIICTVNQYNRGDVLGLLDIADELGASLLKFHVFSTIGTGHGNAELAMTPPQWVEFCDNLNQVAPQYQTRVWYQPTYARRDQMARYQAAGYQGCIGRTLDRISIFPDGRCYVCSYLFDTDLYFAQMDGDQVRLNHGSNEFDLFTKPLVQSACGGCKAAACLGGCPAEEVVMGGSSCDAYEDIVPVCRLWKSSAKHEE